MSLSERLKRASTLSATDPATDVDPVAPVGAEPAPPAAVAPAVVADDGNATDTVAPEPIAPAAATSAARLGETPSDVSDPLVQLKRRVQASLLRRLGARSHDHEVTEAELRDIVTRELQEFLLSENIPLSDDEREQLVGLLSADVLGYGPIEPLLADESVTEVMVNGARNVYIERAGHLEEVDVHFASDEHLRQVIDRIVSRVGRRIDESSPMVDARLADGSRVNAVIPPLAVDGPSLTIRKFSRRVMSVEDLVASGSMSPETAELFAACVKGRLNILVTGGTGSGKTTLLNIFSSFIPDDQRIVTIEDSVELQLHQRHVVRLEARPPNIDGRGEITIRDLVRNALRMRPDRIIVGEVRSGEALDMLQAMNTGHDGSLSTLHANQPRDALSRLETMVLMAGFDLPVRAIREQVASAIDLIVHISRLRDGSRRITHVVEVEGMESDIITTTDLFVFDYGPGLDTDGRVLGELRPTGLRPKFAERLSERGIVLPTRVLGLDPAAPPTRAFR